MSVTNDVSNNSSNKRASFVQTDRPGQALLAPDNLSKQMENALKPQCAVEFGNDELDDLLMGLTEGT